MKQMLIYLYMMFIVMILVMLVVLLSVAFLTLMERKFLGYIQIRKGPNKLGLIGLMQPFSDAIKLLSKENIMMNKMNFIPYLYSPVLSLVLILMMWMIYPFLSNYLVMNLGFIYLLCCFSFSVYGLLLAGWASNSMYSMLGSIRSLAQSISYEVSLAIIMIIPFMIMSNFNLKNFLMIQNKMGLIYFMWPLGLMFFFSIMAELNRTPFDFSEGESELVSGFNIEYSSVGFTLIFLSEYSSIILLSFFFNLIYLGGQYMNFMFYIQVMLMSILIIWIRGTFPRFRYDLLMYLCWLVILPFSLNYMFMMIMIKMILFK